MKLASYVLALSTCFFFCAKCFAIDSKTNKGTAPKNMKADEQKLAGIWSGQLTLPNSLNMPLVFRFTQKDGNYSGELESPSQSKERMAFDSVVIEKDGTIRAKLAKLLAEFTGHLDMNGTVLKGSWAQNGSSLPVSFKSVSEYVPLKHSQEPVAPFPYLTEELTFKSGDHQMAGTLTLPKASTKPAAVILIHGSGPHDRDENIFGHKPFLLIADQLSRNGIAVLRYDKRGCKKSTGDYAKSTSADFADDAVAAIDYLRSRSDIDGTRIGLIGHSEGGVVAPMVANRKPDEVKFVVLLAGTAFDGEHILIEQVKKLQSGSPAEAEKANLIARRTYEIIKKEPNNELAIEKIIAMRKESGMDDSKHPAELKRDLAGLTGPWYRFFISFDPAVELSKLKCPVLALNGEKDIQVLPDENLARIQECLKKAGNESVRIEKIPNTNHLFQTCKTGMPSEYSNIDETMSPAVLTLVTEWITKQVSK